MSRRVLAGRQGVKRRRQHRQNSTSFAVKNRRRIAQIIACARNANRVAKPAFAGGRP